VRPVRFAREGGRAGGQGGAEQGHGGDDGERRREQWNETAHDGLLAGAGADGLTGASPEGDRPAFPSCPAAARGAPSELRFSWAERRDPRPYSYGGPAIAGPAASVAPRVAQASPRRTAKVAAAVREGRSSLVRMSRT
jgi:hypothetical protein